MMARKKRRVRITKLTDGRGELRPSKKVYEGEALFSASYKYCYFNDTTLEKVKGGIGHGKGGNYGSAGNYIGVEDGESYNVHQYKD